MALLDASYTAYSISLTSTGWSNYAIVQPEDDEDYGLYENHWASAESATSAQQYVEVQQRTGMRAVWGGSGLSYSSGYLDADGTYHINPLTGTLNSLSLYDSNGDLVYKITGLNYTLNGTGSLPSFNVLFSGNDTIKTGGGDDTIAGGAGSDTIDGSLGFDHVTYEGQAAPITVSFTSAGVGTVTTATGTDTLSNIEAVIGSSGNDRITGHATGIAHNLFVGGSGNDTLDGGAGNDTLEGGFGQDSLVGGAGIDTVSYATEGIYSVTLNMATGVASVNEGTVIAETASGFENFIGSTGNDNVTGSTVANLVDGGEGYDTLNGGGGNDTLVGGAEDSNVDALAGGAGNDYYRIEWGSDKSWNYRWDSVTEGFDQGIDTVEVQTDDAFFMEGHHYALGANLENLVLATSASWNSYWFAALGNSLDNLIEARPADLEGYYEPTLNFRLHGDGGNDTLLGAGGNDTLVGGKGDDVMSGGYGNDVYVVDSLGDVVQESANAGNDTLVTRFNGVVLQEHIENLRLDVVQTALTATGNAASNRMVGNAFDNKLDGLTGDDSLFGGDGNDSLYGGTGNDSIAGGIGNDLIDGGDGNDTVSYAGMGVQINVNLGLATAQATGAGNDTIVNVENAVGGSMADTLWGNIENNKLSGLDGNDTLKGFAGNDLLDGGNGNDWLYGGAGADMLRGGDGNDTFVLDIKSPPGTADTIADFLTGTDKIAVSMASFKIGDGDKLIEGAQTRYAAGGFSSAAELVVFTQDIATPLNATAVAASLGNAASAYAAGDTRLFVVDAGYGAWGGTTSAVYLFTSSGADATVSAGELQLVATVSGLPAATTVADYSFVA